MAKDNYQRWLWEKLAEKCIRNLKKHAFEAHFLPNREEAGDFILQGIEAYDSFGLGGSDTIRALGIPEALKSKGKTVHDHWQQGLSREKDREIRLRQGRCDCFLCSANAVSLSGEVVNVDGIGNRTAAMSFGPQKVVVIAGMNKVTMDLDSALRRVREMAGPMRAKSLGMQTPCAETGICTDCESPQRICRITTILHRKPMQTAVTVILINEALGF